MRAVPIIYSLLKVTDSRTHFLANLWIENNNCLSSASCGGGYNSCSTTTSSTKIERVRRTSRITSPNSIVLNKTNSANAMLKKQRKEAIRFREIQSCDLKEKFAENEALAKLVPVLVFDIETTGFRRNDDKIVEIGLQDLCGGKNSTFESLVNPECHVPNSIFHGITTQMVCRPDVPRMKELIPILMQYVRSRQKCEGFVLFVAHNARVFDVPFLMHEFRRCSFDIPPNWLFLDTLPLARQALKIEAMQSGRARGISLEDLCKRYEIEFVGSNHRAMADARALALVLQRLTFDLKLPVSALLSRSFSPFFSK